MKLTRCFGVIFTSLALLFATAPIASAASNSSVVTSRPSITDLETAIVRVKHISGYTTYFPDQNPARLTAADTKFYREYNYLLSIVSTAYSYIENYDSISDVKLQEVIAAASDAEISCYYLFGTAISLKTADSSKVTTSQQTSTSQKSSASSNSAPNTSSLPQSTTSQPQTLVSASQATPNNTKTANPESTSSQLQPTSVSSETTPTNSEHTPSASESTSPDPATQSDSKPAEPTESSSVLPQILAHGATATLACGFAGTLIVRERRRTAYHPKSSSRNSHHR